MTHANVHLPIRTPLVILALSMAAGGVWGVSALHGPARASAESRLPAAASRSIDAPWVRPRRAPSSMVIVVERP